MSDSTLSYGVWVSGLWTGVNISIGWARMWGKVDIHSRTLTFLRSFTVWIFRYRFIIPILIYYFQLCRMCIRPVCFK